MNERTLYKKEKRRALSLFLGEYSGVVFVPSNHLSHFINKQRKKETIVIPQKKLLKIFEEFPKKIGDNLSWSGLKDGDGASKSTTQRDQQ